MRPSSPSVRYPGMKPGVLNTFVRPEGSTTMKPSTEELESQSVDEPTTSTYGPGARTLAMCHVECAARAAGLWAMAKATKPGTMSASHLGFRCITNLRLSRPGRTSAQIFRDSTRCGLHLPL